MICSICYNSEDVKTAKLNDPEIHHTSQLKPQNLTAANIGVFTASLGYDYRHLLHFFSPFGEEILIRLIRISSLKGEKKIVIDAYGY